MTADRDSSSSPPSKPPKKAAQATTKDALGASSGGDKPSLEPDNWDDSSLVRSFNVEAVPIDRRGPLTGKLLEQRYLIKEKLGVGGMGVVYRAEHTLMRKEMAVKVLLPQYGNFEGIKKRFHREAQSSSRLDHPGITHINDFGETEDGLLFIAMEFLSGISLTDIIKKEAPLDLERAVRISMQLCLALDHAHSEGVVHRDLKPDNVMIVEKGDRDDVVKVLDFGIAKITQGDGSADALTEAGMVFGTPEYLSPEQAAGQVADARADLYSLGVIMYELITGTRPFAGPTKLELIGKHINEAPQPMRKRKPDLNIPAELDDVVLLLMAKRPQDRIQSASELFQMVSGLESIATGPLAMWPSNTLTLTGVKPVSLPRPRRARKALLLGGIVGFIAALATVAVLVFTGRWGGSRGIAGAPKPTADAVGKRVPNAQLQGVQAKLVAGNLKDARMLLDRLADQYPTDARVHLLMGRVHFLNKKQDECLRSLKEAVRLDKSMRTNEQLLNSLYVYLSSIKGRGFGWKLRRKAMDFVERYLDAGAKTMLTRFTNTWWERKTVWRAIAFLTKHNAADQVNYPHAYELVFRHETSCAKRKQHMKDVLSRKDPSFLPLMRKIVATPLWKAKYSRRGVANKCIEAEAKAAILVLEALDTDGKYKATDAGVGKSRARPRKAPMRRRRRRRRRRR